MPPAPPAVDAGLILGPLQQKVPRKGIPPRTRTHTRVHPPCAEGPRAPAAPGRRWLARTPSGSHPLGAERDHGHSSRGPQPRSRPAEALPSHTHGPQGSSRDLPPQHQPPLPGAAPAAARAPHAGGREGGWAPAGALRSPDRAGGCREVRLPPARGGTGAPPALRGSVPASAPAPGARAGPQEGGDAPAITAAPSQPPPRLKMALGGRAVRGGAGREASRDSLRPNQRRATSARRAAPALRWRTIR